jgi:hypothetical protein
MATPSTKNPAIEAFLDALSGRSTAIAEDRCANMPIGCEGPAVSFRDELSRREYHISGLCQKCQDQFFGGGQ